MYLAYTGTMRGEENPWIVVTTGVVTRSREGEREEVEAVVDDVELVAALEDGGDVQALRHLGVDGGVLRPACRHDRLQARGGDRVAGREQGDVMSSGDEALGQQRGEQLPGAVVPWRAPPRDGRQDRDPHRVQRSRERSSSASRSRIGSVAMPMAASPIP